MEESQDLDILFTTDDWKPICFHMEPQGAQRQRVRTRYLYRYFLPEVGTHYTNKICTVTWAYIPYPFSYINLFILLKGRMNYICTWAHVREYILFFNPPLLDPNHLERKREERKKYSLLFQHTFNKIIMGTNIKFANK